MYNEKLTILFISHEASLSGAPILLLNLINLLKTDSRYQIRIVIHRGGKLNAEFEKAGKAVILKPAGYQINKPFFKKLVDFAKYKRHLQTAIMYANESDVIFSNTIANGRIVKLINKKNKPVLLYVHELENVISEFNKHGDSDLSFSLASKIFTLSESGTENLIRNHHIDPDKILPLNSFYPISEELANVSKDEKRLVFFSRYNIPPGNFYVAGMGSATLRKGIDIFIDTCIVLKRMQANVHFTWIGDFVEEGVKEEIQKKIVENKIQDSMIITGFLPKAPDNLLPFDLFLLTSREDPYPLVVIEAAYVGMPTLCYIHGGGIKDFILPEEGYLVYENTAEAFAGKILELKKDKKILENRGLMAKTKAIRWHSSPERIKNQLEKGLELANSCNLNNDPVFN
jgi:glycosyltransferase involved in cell wall biosynthesis